MCAESPNFPKSTLAVDFVRAGPGAVGPGGCS